MRWKEGYNLDYLIEYDESNPISIEKYAQALYLLGLGTIKYDFQLPGRRTQVRRPIFMHFHRVKVFDIHRRLPALSNFSFVISVIIIFKLQVFNVRLEKISKNFDCHLVIRIFSTQIHYEKKGDKNYDLSNGHRRYLKTRS